MQDVDLEVVSLEPCSVPYHLCKHVNCRDGHVVIPDAVWRIDRNAFKGCKPESVELWTEAVMKNESNARGDHGLPRVPSVHKVKLHASGNIRGFTMEKLVYMFQNLKELTIVARYPVELLLETGWPDFWIQSRSVSAVKLEGYVREIRGTFPKLLLPNLSPAKCFPALRPQMVETYLKKPEAFEDKERAVYETFLKKAGSSFFLSCLSAGYPSVLQQYLARPFEKAPFTAASFDRFLEEAEKQENLPLKAQILNAKGKFFNLRRLAENREASSRKALEDPCSKEAMKTLWSWTVRDRQSVCMTGFLGEDGTGDPKEETKLIVPDRVGTYAVTEIGKEAFREGTSETYILPESLQKLGKRAFAGNAAVRSITFQGNLHRIPEEAFCECRNLEHFVFPQGLHQIGKDAFRSTALRSLELPRSVQYVETGAFSRCSQLQRITLQGGVLMKKVFAQCAAQKATLRGVGLIAEGLFEGCRKLAFADIRNAWAVEKQAFQECPLQELHVSSKLVEVDAHAFSGAGIRRIVVYGPGDLERVRSALKRGGVDLASSTILRAEDGPGGSLGGEDIG